MRISRLTPFISPLLRPHRRRRRVGTDPQKYPYLQPVEVKPGRQSLDLGDNDDFDSFIRSRDVTAYDSSYAMFRWETDIRRTWYSPR